MSLSEKWARRIGSKAKRTISFGLSETEWEELSSFSRNSGISKHQAARDLVVRELTRLNSFQSSTDCHWCRKRIARTSRELFCSGDCKNKSLSLLTHTKHDGNLTAFPNSRYADISYTDFNVLNNARVLFRNIGVQMTEVPMDIVILAVTYFKVKEIVNGYTKAGKRD